jgi:hypothetical protein
MTANEEIAFVATMAATLLAGSYAGNAHNLTLSAAHHWMPVSDASAAVAQARAIIEEARRTVS